MDSILDLWIQIGIFVTIFSVGNGIAFQDFGWVILSILFCWIAWPIFLLIYCVSSRYEDSLGEDIEV